LNWKYPTAVILVGSIFYHVGGESCILAPKEELANHQCEMLKPHNEVDVKPSREAPLYQTTATGSSFDPSLPPWWTVSL